MSYTIRNICKLFKTKGLIALSLLLLIVGGGIAFFGLNSARALGLDDGDGTLFNPIKISDCLTLQNMYSVGSGSSNDNFILTNDIDCSDTVNWNNGAGFIPIGASDPFSGTLNGKGHTINGLYIYQGDKSDVHTGLFAATTDAAKLTDFKVTNSTVIGSANSSSGDPYATGGIVGDNWAQISNVSFSGDVHIDAGSCPNSGFIGGLVGKHTYQLISRSYSEGSVSVSGPICGFGIAAGGLIGAIDGSGSGSVSDSYSGSDVNFSGNIEEGCGSGSGFCRIVGGLVGYSNTGGSINHSYASGDLIVSDASQTNRAYVIGGLVGRAYNVTINWSFSASNISTPPDCSDQDCGSNLRSRGGLISYLPSYISYIGEGNYFDASAAGTSECGGSLVSGCAGVNNENSQPDYFNNILNLPVIFWDFDTIWQAPSALPSLRSSLVSPSPVANLSAESLRARSIDVSWSEPLPGSSPIQNYYIGYRESNSNDSWTILDVASTADQITINGLSPGAMYDISVYAINLDGHYSGPAIEFSVPVPLPSNTKLITNCSQLQDMEYDLDGDYQLGADIDCSDTINWNSGAGFIPIGRGGNSYQLFTGSFNGNNYTIKNLYINSDSHNDEAVGLFSSTLGAVLQDVKLEGSVVSGGGIMGGFVGIGVDTVAVNIHIKNAVIEGNIMVAGGLFGFTLPYGDTDMRLPNTNNEFSGSIHNVNNDSTYLIGGLYGIISNNLDISNSFANVNMSGRKASFGGGGFAGAVDSDQDHYATITNSYAAGVIDLDLDHSGSQSVYGSFIGEVGGGLLGGQQEMSLNASGNFAATELPIDDGLSYKHGFIGISANQVENIGSNYFDADLSGTTQCVGSGAGSDVCNPISSQPLYFKNNKVNAPLDRWDFAHIWKVTSEYPEFGEEVLNSPSTITPPVVNNNRGDHVCFRVLGINVCTGGSTNQTPTSGSDNQTLVKEIKEGLRLSRGSSEAKSLLEDEHGVIGSLRHFVRSLPPGVVVGFPYVLFSVLVAGSVVALYILWRESIKLKSIMILIKKQEALGEERDTFWHLAANYLRAPITLIVGGAELLSEYISNTKGFITQPKIKRNANGPGSGSGLLTARTDQDVMIVKTKDIKAINPNTVKAISTLAGILQSKVSSIMKSIEDSKTLRAISRPKGARLSNTVRSSLFLGPVIIVGILAILANYMASSWRNLSPGVVGYMAQAIVFILVVLLFYRILELMTKGRVKREDAEELLKIQTSQLSTARQELIKDTSKQLSDDLAHLEKQLDKLESNTGIDKSNIDTSGVMGASLIVPAFRNLEEGTGRLKKILRTFSMLIRLQDREVGLDRASEAVFKEELSLDNLLNSAKKEIEEKAAAKNVVIDTPPITNMKLKAEADLARQVFSSVLANAVEFSPRSSTVRVDVRSGRGFNKVIISDQGPGIDKEQLEHLFQPFTRTDGRTALDLNHEGLGLNLYINKMIMDQLGGSISAVSEVGKGTSFILKW